METTATAAAAPENETVRQRLEREADEAKKVVESKKPGREVRAAFAEEFEEFIVFVTPTRAELRMYMAKRENEKEGVLAAQEFLVDVCVMFPDKAGLAKQLDRRPGLFYKWAGEIVESTGLIAQVTQKKL